MMSKILVTGATGFIGKELVAYLHGRGHEVRVLLRDQAKSSLFPREIEIYPGDLCHLGSLANLCTNVQTVFHLAGYAHANRGPHFASLHHEVNFKGTENILHVAVKAKVEKFIYFSSVKAVADHKATLDETWEMQPTSPYGRAKRAAELAVLETGKQYAMSVSILRPALVYGPDWKGNLATMLKAIIKGYFLPIPEVKHFRSMISVNDICRAAVMAANNPAANGKTYFVTDNIPYSSRDIYLLMMKALGKRIPAWHVPLNAFKLLAMAGDLLEKVVHKPMPFNAETLDKLFGQALYSSKRIQQELAFEPKDTLETMLPFIIKCYQQTEVKDGKQY